MQYPAVSLFVLAIGCALVTTGKAESLRTFKSGAWAVASYSDDATKAFSHCGAFVSYKNNVVLHTALYKTGGWAIGFQSQSWNLHVGDDVPITALFDDANPSNGKGKVLTPSFVLVNINPNSNIWESFRQAQLMSISAFGQIYQFRLDGTSRMMVALKECVDAENAYAAGGPVPVFFSSSPPQSNQSLSHPLVVTASREPAISPAELELSATRIATNLLLQAHFTNARLVAKTDVSSYARGRGAAWTADGASGNVIIVPKIVATDAQVAATQITQSDSGSCKGDFASGRSQELVDGAIITRVLTACKAAVTTWAIRYFIVESEKDGWIIYSIAGGDGDTPKSDGQPLSDSRFQSAAIRAASYK